MSDEMTEDEKKVCKASEKPKPKKKGAFTIPDAYFKQMAVCGRCGMCSAFAGVKDVWKSLKRSIKMTLKKVRNTLFGAFGYHHAGADTIQKINLRLDNLIMLGVRSQKTSQSFLEAPQVNSTADRKLPWDSTPKEREDFFEEALLETMSHMTQEEKMKHLDAIEKSWSEISDENDFLSKQEQLFFSKGRQKQVERLMQQQAQMNNTLNKIRDSPDCKKALEGAKIKDNLELAINVEFPDVAKAMYQAALGSPFGALDALIPEVLLMAVPKKNQALKDEYMGDCLEQLDAQQKDYLESCTDERPFLACAARTYQRILGKAVREKWFPIDDKIKNPGQVLKAVDLASKKSCLEDKPTSDDKLDRMDLTNTPESNWQRWERFEKAQCPMVSGRVDEDDGDDDLDPKISHKVWVASLMGQAASINESPDTPITCPNVLPFVAAYCASELKCVEEPDVVGAGYDRNVNFSSVRQQIREWLTKEDSNGDGMLDTGEESNAWTHLNKELDDVDLAENPNAEVKRWNLMWSVVNKSAPGDGSNDWPGILKTFEAQSTRPVHWASTSKLWNRIFSASDKMLKAKERRYNWKRHGIASLETRGVHEVLEDLNKIYQNNMCGPSGIGVMSQASMMKLGVSADAAAKQAQVYSSAKSSQMKWAVLRVQVKASWPYMSVPSALGQFQSALSSHGCECMCMRTKGAIYGSKLVPTEQVNACTSLSDMKNTMVGLGGMLETIDSTFKTEGSEGEVSMGPITVKIVEAGGTTSSCSQRLTWTASGQEYSGYISKCSGPKSVMGSTLSALTKKGPRQGYLSIPIVIDS
eukprot:TRINITY_DN4092_c0_g4_i1.p1 TRINITY_DN4092_c0_g4~~TRINITY_DN4092_c0_g4_i1.p1  ORF type:complete len:938 (+),score=167.66 TRINITY_DN4092_c0_g4_i1:383-2815(+)